MKLKVAAVLSTFLVVGGCDDPAGPGWPAPLVVRGSSALIGEYGGRPIHLALLDAEGRVVSRQEATIAQSGSVAFRVTLAYFDASEREDFEVVAWLDANDGGGGPGACDAIAIDPQFRLTVEPGVDREITLDDDALATSAVCPSFTVNFTLRAGAGFSSEHGGQDIVVRVIDGITGALRAQTLAQISGTTEPAFEFVFRDVLVVGRPYEVRVWVDSNIDGGAPGVCDPPAHDSQWAHGLGITGEDDVTWVLLIDTQMTTICPFVV